MIVVSYNSARELRSWRPDLVAAGLELIVVDNGSHDDSVTAAQDIGARVVAQAQNAGWSKACNVGAGLATSDVLLFVNPDVTLDPDAARQLAKRAYETRRPVVPRFVNPDGSRQSFYHRLPSALTGLFLYLNAGQRLDGLIGSRVSRHARYDDRAEQHGVVDHGGGACTAITRSLFEELGGFDESMWLFFADTDLSRRAARAGHPLEVVWNVEVAHEGGSGVKREPWQHMQIVLQRDYLAYARASHTAGWASASRWPALCF